jgi:hypothetical protein
MHVDPQHLENHPEKCESLRFCSGGRRHRLTAATRARQQRNQADPWPWRWRSMRTYRNKLSPPDTRTQDGSKHARPVKTNPSVHAYACQNRRPGSRQGPESLVAALVRYESWERSGQQEDDDTEAERWSKDHRRVCAIDMMWRDTSCCAARRLLFTVVHVWSPHYYKHFPFPSCCLS